METKKLIKDVMDSTGYTLTKLAQDITETTGQKTTVQNISNKLQRDTVRVYELEQWLNIMGYTIDCRPIDRNYIDNFLIESLRSLLPREDFFEILPLLTDNKVPYKLKETLRNVIAHNGLDDVRIHIQKFVRDAIDYINIDSCF